MFQIEEVLKKRGITTCNTSRMWLFFTKFIPPWVCRRFRTLKFNVCFFSWMWLNVLLNYSSESKCSSFKSKLRNNVIIYKTIRKKRSESELQIIYKFWARCKKSQTHFCTHKNTATTSNRVTLCKTISSFRRPSCDTKQMIGVVMANMPNK